MSAITNGYIYKKSNQIDFKYCRHQSEYNDKVLLSQKSNNKNELVFYEKKTIIPSSVWVYVWFELNVHETSSSLRFARNVQGFEQSGVNLE